MNSDPGEPSGDVSESASFSLEVLYILSSLDIITRSIHNCRVFSYYGGVQKVIALLKGTLFVSHNFYLVIPFGLQFILLF